MEILPTANFQPDISLWGFRIGEPVIALTSLLVALFCFYAWQRLGKAKSADDAARLFRVFFLLMGFSSLLGGLVGHAFMHQLPFVFKVPGWALGMIAVSALEQVSILRATPFLGRGWGRVLSWANIVQLAVALWFMFATLWFPAVEIHSAVGLLLVVAPLESMLLLRFRSEVSRFVLWGIAVLVVAVSMHIFKISASVWLSYFDVAHLWMCGAIWLFMQGALRLGKAGQA